MDMISIYRGDDTDFDGIQTIEIELDTDLDLTGMSARFVFLDITKSFTDITSKKLTITMSSAETSTLPYGSQFATIFFYDTSKRVKAIDNRIPIFVTDEIDKVNVAGGTIKINAKVKIDWNFIKNAPNFVLTINGEAADENGNFVISELTLDDTVSSSSSNGVMSSGIYQYVQDQMKQVGHYLTADADGNAFEEKTVFDTACANNKFYYNGVKHNPDINDYCVILADGSKANATTRYVCTSSYIPATETSEAVVATFAYQYTVATAITQAQLNAMNSGITEDKRKAYDALKGLPTSTSAQAGKVLTVGADGTAAWADSAVPSQYVESAVKSADGKTLTITPHGGTAFDFSGGGGEPDAYLKSASADEVTGGNQLVINDKDGNKDVDLFVPNVVTSLASENAACVPTVAAVNTGLDGKADGLVTYTKKNASGCDYGAITADIVYHETDVSDAELTILSTTDTVRVPSSYVGKTVKIGEKLSTGCYFGVLSSRFIKLYKADGGELSGDFDVTGATKSVSTSKVADSAKFNGQTEAELLGLTDGEPTNEHVSILFSHMDTSPDVQTSNLLNNSVLEKSIALVDKYDLSAPTGTADKRTIDSVDYEGHAYTAAYDAITAITQIDNEAAIFVDFPAAVANKARDFIVRLTIGATTTPSIIFGNNLATAPVFETDADGDAFSKWTFDKATSGTVTYLVSFTETASGTFLAAKKGLQ